MFYKERLARTLRAAAEVGTNFNSNLDRFSSQAPRAIQIRPSNAPRLATPRVSYSANHLTAPHHLRTSARAQEYFQIFRQRFIDKYLHTNSSCALAHCAPRSEIGQSKADPETSPYVTLTRGTTRKTAV